MLVKTRLEALYIQEKVACDMGKSAKTEEEKSNIIKEGKEKFFDYFSKVENGEISYKNEDGNYNGNV